MRHTAPRTRLHLAKRTRCMYRKLDKSGAQKPLLPKQSTEQDIPGAGQHLENGSIRSGSSPRLGTTLRGTEWTDPPKLPTLGSILSNASLSRLDLPSQPWASGDEFARPRTSHGSGSSPKQSPMDDIFVTGSVGPRRGLSRGARPQPGVSPYDAVVAETRHVQLGLGIDRAPNVPKSPLSTATPSQASPNPAGMHNAQSLSDNNLSTISSSTADISGLFDVSPPSSNGRDGSPDSVSSIASPSSASRYQTRDPASTHMRLQSRPTAARPQADTRARDVAKQKDLSIKVPRRKSWSTEINQLEKSWLEEQLSPRPTAERPPRPEQRQQRQQRQINAGANGRGPSPRQGHYAHIPEERGRNLGKAGGVPLMPLSPLPRDSSRNARNDFAAYENAPHHGLRTSSSRTNLARGGPQSPHDPHFQRDPRTVHPPRGNPTMPPHLLQGRPPTRAQYPSHPGQADPHLQVPRNQSSRTRIPPMPPQNPMGHRDPNHHGLYGQNTSRMRSPASPHSPHSPFGPPLLQNASGSRGPRPQGPHPHGPQSHGPPRLPFGRHPTEAPVPPTNYRSVPTPSDRRHPSATNPGHVNTYLPQSLPRNPVDHGKPGSSNVSKLVRTMQTGQAEKARVAYPPQNTPVAPAKASPPVAQAVQPDPQKFSKPASQLPSSPDGDTACSLPPTDFPPTPVSRKDSLETLTDTTINTPQSSPAPGPQSERAHAAENTCENATPVQKNVDTEVKTCSSVPRGRSVEHMNDEQQLLPSHNFPFVDGVDSEATVEGKPEPTSESVMKAGLEVNNEAPPEAEREVEPEPQLKAEPEAGPEAGPGRETKAVHGAEPDAQPESDHEMALETEPESFPQLVRISLPSPTADWPLPSPRPQVAAEAPAKFTRPATPMALTPFESTFTRSSSAENTVSGEEDGGTDVSPANSVKGLSPPRSNAFTASVYAQAIGAGPYAFDNGHNSTALSAYNLETAGSTPWLPSLRQDALGFFSHPVAAKPAMVRTPDMGATNDDAWGAETPEGALSPESIGLARGLSICASPISPRGIIRNEVRQPLDTTSLGGQIVFRTAREMGMGTANNGVATGRPGRGQVGQQTHTGMVDSFGTGFI